MSVDRLIGTVIGIATGLLAYFLFDFHFWQSLAIAWFAGLQFAFLAAILLAVKQLSDQ